MTANSVVNQIFQSESFVLQKGLNCPKPTIQGFGTPESLFLYKTHDSMQVSTPESLFLYKTHDSMQLVHQKAFSCTKPTIQGVGSDGLSLYKPTIQGGWYTRRPFPVQTPRFKAVGTPESLFLYQIHNSMQLVHQTAFSCTKSTIQGVGTPESLFLYQLQSSN